jgi:hypothetical protein
MVVLLVPGSSWAQTSSGFPLNLLPDGRPFRATIPNATTWFFFVNQTAGNSYSMEVIGDFPFGWPQGAANISSGPINTCAPTLVHTQASDPIIFSSTPTNNVGDRVSWTAACTGFSEFQITNNTGGPVSFIASATDTTLFSTAWSTNGSFNTFYSLYNTTGQSCNGVLTLFNTGGTSVTTSSVNIPARATTSTNTVALGTVRNTTGTARFSHDCPPGAVLAEAAIANFSIAPTPYFQFVNFRSTRSPIQ